MYILGLSGGLDLCFDPKLRLPATFAHDAAAVLLKDGKVVAAIEEERLKRIKHTNSFPNLAIQRCLEIAGIAANDVDIVAYYVTESFLDLALDQYSTDVYNSGRDRVLNNLQIMGFDIDQSQLKFVAHHEAHAAATYYQSGWDESLILTLDGQAEDFAGAVHFGKGSDLHLLYQFPAHKSLGIYFVNVIKYLGYGMFDEYKVMGLAPYGDPSVYRSMFQKFYSLLPEGDFELYPHALIELNTILPDRRRPSQFTKVQQHVAAALQESLEIIVFHLIHQLQRVSGVKNLCLAGGVAHNCSLNGKLLLSGIFNQIFVHPAAHDAGCALGAALRVQASVSPLDLQRQRLSQVAWGTPLPSEFQLQEKLEAWGPSVKWRRMNDKAEEVAQLLADGAVVGWMQGRSEFGPRALGHRSILADPRPESNKDRINAMIKKRESYRPFAPAVLESHAREYFELPEDTLCSPFMTFVLPVREQNRLLLGATTHTDGTARVQTVGPDQDPEFRELLESFERKTGLPILLNTSFNNHAEPIVDSVEDAITCFLTTDLNYVAIGPFLVERGFDLASKAEHLEIAWHPAAGLKEEYQNHSGNQVQHVVSFNYDRGRSRCIPAPLYQSLKNLSQTSSLSEWLLKAKTIVDDPWFWLETLWSDRFILILPRIVKLQN